MGNSNFDHAASSALAPPTLERHSKFHSLRLRNCLALAALPERD
jgi:hypothetical protein